MKPLLIAAANLWCLSVIAAPTPAPVRTEIDVLLDRLQSSGCQFNRNGAWHSGSEAKDHLLRKLKYIEREDTIQSTEQFIEFVASKSGFSSQAYQVRCDGQTPVASQAWLTRQLAIIRGAAGHSNEPALSPQGDGGKPPVPEFRR
jgi:hypothetical protein